MYASEGVRVELKGAIEGMPTREVIQVAFALEDVFCKPTSRDPAQDSHGACVLRLTLVGMVG
jgi:hypothetical protein